MTEAETPPLSIVFARTVAMPGFPPTEKAWRIQIVYRGQERSSHLGFARQRDAEIALKALIAAGYDTPEKIAELDPQERRRVMCDALPW